MVEKRITLKLTLAGGKTWALERFALVSRVSKPPTVGQILITARSSYTSYYSVLLSLSLHIYIYIDICVYPVHRCALDEQSRSPGKRNASERYTAKDETIYVWWFPLICIKNMRQRDWNGNMAISCKRSITQRHYMDPLYLFYYVYHTFLYFFSVAFKMTYFKICKIINVDSRKILFTKF